MSHGKSKIGLARSLRELPGLPGSEPFSARALRVAEFCDYLGRLLEDHGGRVRWQGLNVRAPAAMLDLKAPDGTPLIIEIKYGNG